MGKGSRQNGAKLVTYIIGMTQVVMPPIAYAQSGASKLSPMAKPKLLCPFRAISQMRTQTISGTTGLNSFSVF